MGRSAIQATHTRNCEQQGNEIEYVSKLVHNVVKSNTNPFPSQPPSHEVLVIHAGLFDMTLPPLPLDC